MSCFRTTRGPRASLTDYRALPKCTLYYVRCFRENKKKEGGGGREPANKLYKKRRWAPKCSSPLTTSRFGDSQHLSAPAVTTTALRKTAARCGFYHHCCCDYYYYYCTLLCLSERRVGLMSLYSTGLAYTRQQASIPREQIWTNAYQVLVRINY